MTDNNKDPRVPEESQSLTDDTADSAANEQKSKNGNDKIKSSPPDPLLGQQAEEYLRESANIEDMPNEQDEDEFDRVKKEEDKSFHEDQA